MRSQRQLKVGEEIRHVLSIMFQRGDVPWPVGFAVPIVTISEVQVSPDLRNATVFFTCIEDVRIKDIERVLNGIVGPFRHHLAQNVRLRYVPKLAFKVDTSFAYASAIEKILSDPKVARDVQVTVHDSAVEQVDEEN